MYCHFKIDKDADPACVGSIEFNGYREKQKTLNLCPLMFIFLLLYRFLLLPLKLTAAILKHDPMKVPLG